MSRLDSFIRRMTAQRDCLNWAAAAIADLPGPVLELGLGNGRTFDHLRALLPGREIFVFDRQINAHPDCIPDAAHLLLGEMTSTLPALAARIGTTAALVHADVGSGDEAANAALARLLSPLIEAVLRPGGILLADQNIGLPGWQDLPAPAGVPAGRYHIRRKPG